ncbi:MAG: acylneuraminate cytidylyltransferase family protein [Nitrospirota bacterium]|nr:acylneuraminate cytidylyltransferase family protein [Nitrospirota bacterium]
MALIPARAGSKGLPGKNLMTLCDKPLLAWPVEAALKSKHVDTVVVSTDSEQMAQAARLAGAEVPFLRPPEFSSDTSSSASVIEHALSFLSGTGRSFDYILLLEPTSPMTETVDIDSALSRLDSNRTIADSIVGVSRSGAAHPVFSVLLDEGGTIRPYEGGSPGSIRRQDVPDVYFFDGSLYISDVAVFLEKKTFYHKRTLGHLTPKWKSFEVDDIVDFICVEAIMKNIERVKAGYKD